MTIQTQYITVKEAAQLLGVNDSRVRQLLMEDRIEGAEKHGHIWLIPNPPVVKPVPRGAAAHRRE